jgi:hypothetical protein
MSTLAPRQVDAVPPEALAAFHRELEARGVDLSLYQPYFEETDSELLLTALYKLKPRGLRGSVAGHPDYTVVVSRSDFTVTRVSLGR